MYDAALFSNQMYDFFAVYGSAIRLPSLSLRKFKPLLLSLAVFSNTSIIAAAKTNCSFGIRSCGYTFCQNIIANAYLELGSFPCEEHKPVASLGSLESRPMIKLGNATSDERTSSLKRTLQSFGVSGF